MSDLITAAPGATVKHTFLDSSGLVGSAGVRIISGVTTTMERTTSGIIEYPAGSGVYEVTVTAPTTAGTYTLLVDDGAATPNHVVVVNLVVGYSSTLPAPETEANLCTLERVRTVIGVDDEDTSRDALAALYIVRASARMIEVAGREFAPAAGPVERRFPIRLVATGARWVVVDFVDKDLREATEVTLDPDSDSPRTLVADTEYELLPLGAAKGGTYLRMRVRSDLVPSSPSATWFDHGWVAVEGLWGFASVPEEVSQLCAEVVASWLDRRIAAAMPADVDDRDAAPSRSFGNFDVPPFAVRSLRPWARRI